MSRRQQILDVAAKLFAQRGFRGVSVGDLGAACGMSGPALYKHFLNKETILAELLESVSRDLLEGAQQCEMTSESPHDTVCALIAFHADFSVRRRELIVVHERELSALPEESQARVRQLQRDYVTIMARQLGLLHKGMDLPETVARAHVLFGLLNSTPHSGQLPESELRAVLQEMAELAVGCR